MRNYHKNLLAATAVIATGAVLGIFLLSRKDTDSRKKMNAQCKQLLVNIKSKFFNKIRKPGHLRADMEEAIKEAFAENPEEYA